MVVNRRAFYNSWACWEWRHSSWWSRKRSDSLPFQSMLKTECSIHFVSSMCIWRRLNIFNTCFYTICFSICFQSLLCILFGHFLCYCLLPAWFCCSMHCCYCFATGCSFQGDFYRNGEEWHPNIPPFGTSYCVKCRCKVSMSTIQFLHPH